MTFKNKIYQTNPFCDPELFYNHNGLSSSRTKPSQKNEPIFYAARPSFPSFASVQPPQPRRRSAQPPPFNRRAQSSPVKVGEMSFYLYAALRPSLFLRSALRTPRSRPMSRLDKFHIRRNTPARCP
jgi:hypothetical protein